MVQPMRSQSFRHRTQPPHVVTKRSALEDLSNSERRRSTPTITRRCSLQKGRIIDASFRTDVWPEPKQISEIEERFLKLPDFEDYTRVRQFKIDAKGAVVNRGDSFRRKRNSTINKSYLSNNKIDSIYTPFPTTESDNSHLNENQSTLIDSCSTSVSSRDSSRLTKKNSIYKNTDNASILIDNSTLTLNDPPSTSHLSYKVFVLGQTNSGKSSLINQFITSEYRNAFIDDIEDKTNVAIVSVNIGGYECDLNFLEADSNIDNEWRNEKVDAYVLVYSIDKKSSFRTVLNALEIIRNKQISVPIILAGNKIDLERKRAVLAQEVKCVSQTYGVVNFEISVALNHDVDDLLVGIVAEIKDSIGVIHNLNKKPANNLTNSTTNINEFTAKEPEEFRAAIRRFSQRKKRQMGAAAELDAGKCTYLIPTNLFEKFRDWRHRMSKC